MCFLPLLANNVPDKTNLQIGRYQMIGLVSDLGDQQLYLLDTATGQVWHSKSTNSSWLGNWHDAWELQISQGPE